METRDRYRRYYNVVFTNPCGKCQSKSGRTPSHNILCMFLKPGAKLSICKTRPTIGVHFQIIAHHLIHKK